MSGVKIHWLVCPLYTPDLGSFLLFQVGESPGDESRFSPLKVIGEMHLQSFAIGLDRRKALPVGFAIISHRRKVFAIESDRRNGRIHSHEFAIMSDRRIKDPWTRSSGLQLSPLKVIGENHRINFRHCFT
jgi:hypothetical protein